MNTGAVRRPQGRPKLRPKAVVGDKAFNSGKLRKWIRDHHMAGVIPHFHHQRRRGTFSKNLYRARNLVERAIGRLKEFRRLATRYEKLGDRFRNMWLIGAILLAVE